MFPNRNLLSKREQDVTACLVHGLSNKEAARELHISPRTIEDHRKNVLAKLQVKNTVQLARYVYQVQ